MESAALVVRETNGALSVDTGTGLRLMQGTARINTDRGVAHQRHLRRLSSRAIEFWLTLRNTHSAPLKIKRITLWDGRIEAEGAWDVMHQELFRQTFYLHGYNVYTQGLVQPLARVEGEFGRSEDFPFPAIFFTHRDGGTLMMATLSQERCVPVWRLKREGRSLRMEAADHFSGIPAIPVAPGSEFSTERWLILYTPGGATEAIDEYYRLLSKRFRFPGRDSCLREEVAWGSYNFNRRPRGCFDINHDYILANARALSKITRKPFWVYPDLGYGPGKSQERGAFCHMDGVELFYPGSKESYDRKLFPKGMRGFTDAVRRLGGKCAIWSGCTRIWQQSRMAQEHPDWLMPLFRDGPGYRDGASLDYSIPEVRQHARACWDRIFNDWGFMGIKMDFWDYCFVINEMEYRHKDRTAVELRNQSLQDMRDFMPKGGFILAVGGNVFTGRYVEACRMSFDTGDAWWVVHRDAVDLSVMSLFYRHDCLLGDPDAFCWNPSITLRENRTAATLGLMSGAMCELGGDLTHLKPEERKTVQTVVDFFGPARRTTCGVIETSVDRLPATQWTLEREDGVYEAYLNWQYLPLAVHLPRPVREIWSGERLSGVQHIPPHGCLFFKRP